MFQTNQNSNIDMSSAVPFVGGHKWLTKRNNKRKWKGMPVHDDAPWWILTKVTSWWIIHENIGIWIDMIMEYHGWLLSMILSFRMLSATNGISSSLPTSGFPLEPSGSNLPSRGLSGNHLERFEGSIHGSEYQPCSHEWYVLREFHDSK